MNERIKELAKRAGGNPNYKAFRGHFLPPPPDYIDPATVDLEKFAELIVRECAALCSQAAEENARTFYAVSETQEVGPALVAKGSQVQAEKLAKHIREHFGADDA